MINNSPYAVSYLRGKAGTLRPSLVSFSLLVLLLAPPRRYTYYHYDYLYYYHPCNNHLPRPRPPSYSEPLCLAWRGCARLPRSRRPDWRWGTRPGSPLRRRWRGQTESESDARQGGRAASREPGLARSAPQLPGWRTRWWLRTRKQWIMVSTKLSLTIFCTNLTAEGS